MNKIKNAFIILAFWALVMIPLGCFGDVKTEEFDFSDFARVEVGSAFEVAVTKSSSYSVRITADRDKFEFIQVIKEGNTLKIGLKPHDDTLRFHTLGAKITMPDIYGLNLSGASNGAIQGFSFAHEFSSTFQAQAI